MTLTPDDLALLLKTFQNSDWTEMTLSVDGITVSFGKGGLEGTREPPAPCAEPLEPPPARAPESHTVRAGSVGVFRRSASPDAGPLADTGQRVDAGDVIGLLQVFRRLDEIRAGASGIVRAIHVADGDVVEYGELLFTIEPDSREAAR